MGRRKKQDEWDAADKFQAASTALQWVKRYNNYEELTDSRPEGVYQITRQEKQRLTGC